MFCDIKWLIYTHRERRSDAKALEAPARLAASRAESLRSLRDNQTTCNLHVLVRSLSRVNNERSKSTKEPCMGGAICYG